MADQILAVFAVLALLGGAMWWLRSRGLARFSPAGGGRVRQMEILERLPLTPQHSLHLVRLANRTVLVGTSPAGCVMLERIQGEGA